MPIAILTNALRVSGTGVLAHYYGTQVADGFFHNFSGWIIYVVAFILLFAFGSLLDFTAQKLGFGKRPRLRKSSEAKLSGEARTGGADVSEPAVM